MNQNACNVCPKKCKVDRNINCGFCGANNNLKIAKYMLHFWEEPIISGKNGSGAIFFSNCNLKCVYCQNYEISSMGNGKYFTIDEFINIIKELEKKNANNINLVSPTQYSNQIIEALKIYKPKIPVIWNTNSYESVETLKKLDGLVDIYLADYKYFDNSLAISLSNAPNYNEICLKAISEMKRQVGNNIIENGIMKKGLIIRHLILPSYLENSLNVLSSINKVFGKNEIISIMNQYTPCFKALNHPQLKNKLKLIEYKIVIKKAEEIGFENVYTQNILSANTKYIPDFNNKE